MKCLFNLLLGISLSCEYGFTSLNKFLSIFKFKLIQNNFSKMKCPDFSGQNVLTSMVKLFLKNVLMKDFSHSELAVKCPSFLTLLPLYYWAEKLDKVKL